MPNHSTLPQKLTALLVYGRPPLVFGGMLCAIAVMWSRDLDFYKIGVFLLLVAMCFELTVSWFAARFPPHATMANLADRVMDKIVSATLFPLVAVGMMWRLIFVLPDHSRPEMLHAILVLIVCITVLIRDNFAHFMRSSANPKGVEAETIEFTRLRVMVAAPIGVLLYIHAFYLPGGIGGSISALITSLALLPTRIYLIIEILFLIINFGSIGGLCRKYGTMVLNEVCHEDDVLRRKILAFFPNTLTVFNALLGILAVLFTQQGWLRQAYLFVIGAAIFDKLDGAVARKLGLTAPSTQTDGTSAITLGGLLDDIADGISFCLAPALIFHMTMAEYPEFAIAKPWPMVAATTYALLGLARLIYFSLDRTPIPGFFKGMPTTASALLVVAPLLMFKQAAIEGQSSVYLWGIICFLVMMTASIAMNLYPVRYLHIGRTMDRNPWFARFCVFLLLVSIFSPYFGFLTMTYLLLYLLSPIFTRRMEPKPPQGS
ncbi:MAG: CDP-alcohol phosphatidyltransferase family protein [Proteobacteria bacterium]|nr:CDP-alcohol phosphatidyltransferase family protein [Pseudomonadota bacterium]MBU1688738.1 CDP-alcohol phosphatidyltransferase family protein [Pseudomonadota bacterium]